MNAKKALLRLNQRIKEQIPDQWLYNKEMRKWRQRKWGNKKWDKALLAEFVRPSFFEGFLCSPKLIGPMKGYDNKGGDSSEE